MYITIWSHDTWNAGTEKQNLGLDFQLDSWPIKLKLFKPKGVLSNTSNSDQVVGTNEIQINMYAPVSAYTFMIRCPTRKGHVSDKFILVGQGFQDGRDNLANVRVM